MSTARLGLPYPDLTDSANVPSDLEALADAIDVAAIDDQGILSARPVSTSGSPGVKGRYYMVKGDATAANNGILWRDNGTGWDRVGGVGSTADTLVNRPTAASMAGGFFYATDQDVLYRSDGTGWTRVGPSRAGDIVWTLNTVAEPGRILCQGQVWPAIDGIYADLYAKWGGASLPDLRGRMPVVVGTHTDVNAVGKNDGLAVGARRTKHRTSIATAYVPATNNPGVSSGTVAQGDGGSTNANPVNVAAGPQTGSEPIDTPAYYVFNAEAKL